MREYVRNQPFMSEYPSFTPNMAIAYSQATITPTEGLLNLWLHGKSPHTQRYYRREALKFLSVVNKPIESITLADVQGYATALNQSSLAVSSVARAIAAIKSLFTFAHQKTGLLKGEHLTFVMSTNTQTQN